MISLDKCYGSCNTFTEISVRICIPNKTENVNWNVFNFIKTKSESKTFEKHLSFEFNCKLDSKGRNSNQTWNKNKYTCECKIPRKSMCEKNIIFGILLHEVMKMVDMQKALLAIQWLHVMTL